MSDILPLAALFTGGIFASLYGSIVGGAGLISFPLLVFAGLSTPEAIATQRLAAVFLELASAAKLHRIGRLDLRTVFPFAVCASFGALIGANLVPRIEVHALNIVVSILLVAALAIVWHKERFALMTLASGKNQAAALLLVFLLSIYGGFFGAGYGFLVIAAFMLFGLPLFESAALSRAIGFFMSLTGVLVFAGSGMINYAYGVSVGAGFAVGSWIGIAFALKHGDRYIKPVLLIVVAVTVAKLLLDLR